jgi:hypothetical protein
MYYNYEMMQRVILPACSRLAGKPVLKFTSIIDMDGIGMTDLMSKNIYNMVSLSSKMVQEYYPEIVNKSYILNTPMLFSGFFNVVKPLLGTRTQEALCMPGSKFKKELTDAIDAQYLPVEYGGTCAHHPKECVDRGDYIAYISKALELKKWDVTPEDLEEKKPEIAATIEVQAIVQAEETPEVTESPAEGEVVVKAPEAEEKQ